MKCTECGVDLVPGFRFCGNCGAPAPLESPFKPDPGTPQSNMTRPSASVLSGWLIVESGSEAGHEFRLRGTMRIGRTEGNEIVLEDGQISRHHAAVSREPGGYVVQDLYSSNGTFVNGQRIDEPRLLRDGDRIQIGNTILVFRWMPSSTPPPTPLSYMPEAAMFTPSAAPPAPGSESLPTETGRRSGLPVSVLVLGTLLAVLICALVASALFLLLGNSDHGPSFRSSSQGTPLTITQVATNAPAQVVTVVATSEPQATETLAPLATPTPSPTITLTPAPVTVRIAPDGSGDYASLEAAVKHVPAGSTVNLDPGTYRLATGLQITKSLSLNGSGMEETHVVGDEEGQVVLFEGPGTFSVQGITFRYEGSAWARVMTITDAEIDISGCRFTGGVWSEEEKKGGDGLLLWGQVTGSIRESRFEDNTLHGVELQDQAMPTLEGNVVTNNGQSGIVYFEEASGTARENECSGNKLHGISVNEQAQPVIEANICKNNGEVGIRFSDSTGGAAGLNESTGNGLHGIVVRGDSQPTLEENICSGNTKSGIVYFDNAVGLARRNKCLGNGLHGIDVYDHAQPDLEANICSDNSKVGIRFSDTSGGVARQNGCTGNGLNGIVVRDEAKPTLEENVCKENRKSGMAYFGSSGGLAHGNQCTGNGLHGISVSEQAVPVLESNICTGNTQIGIVYFDDAAGTARQNTCSENSLHGIGVNDQAQPTLEDNVCQNNAQVGLRYSGRVTVTARRNTSTGNGLHGFHMLEQAKPLLEDNISNDNVEGGFVFFDGAGGVARQNECIGNKWGIYVANTADPELVENDCRNNSAADVDDRR